MASKTSTTKIWMRPKNEFWFFSEFFVYYHLEIILENLKLMLLLEEYICKSSYHFYSEVVYKHFLVDLLYLNHLESIGAFKTVFSPTISQNVKDEWSWNRENILNLSFDIVCSNRCEISFLKSKWWSLIGINILCTFH